MRIALVLSLTFASCFASVDFLSSTLYDVYDFVGNDEVLISSCDYGCLIFASTWLDGFNSSSGYDPYAENLIIQDNNHDRNYSITDLSRMFDETTAEKTALTIEGPASISVLNLNAVTDAFWPIVLYVVDRARARDFSYSVYDALNMTGITVNPSNVITVMGADPFTLTAAPSGSMNGLIARLAGFENVLDANPDDCPRALEIAPQSEFPGFNLNVNGPIISIAFDLRNAVQMEATRGKVNILDLDNTGFITSAGYNGCTKRFSQGVQSFRSNFYDTSDSFIITSDNLRDVSIDVMPNLDTNHSVFINDLSNRNPPYKIDGYGTLSFEFDATKYLEVEFDSIDSADQGFLLTYTSKPAVATTTTKRTTSASSPLSSITSTTSQTTTTSESHAIGGSLLSTLAAFAVARMA